MRIEELLARRSDLSSFLVHLTRTSDGSSGRDRLRSIPSDDRISAFNPYCHGLQTLKGIADPALRDAVLESQRVVCFTETPMEHVKFHLEPIDGRRIQFEPYGRQPMAVRGEHAEPRESERYVIDIFESWQVTAWATMFGVSVETLLDAITLVGNDVDAVEVYLRTHRTREQE
jgi:hypothetical protein